MYRPTKYSVADSTELHVDDHELELAESDFNLETIAEVERSWVGGSESLTREGRIFVLEGQLKKICRKGPKKRHFFLFNDILVYGIPLGQRRYGKQHVLALADLAAFGLGAEHGRFAFQLDHRRKSFVVLANSQAEKEVWMTKLGDYIHKASGRQYGEHVEARAVWVQDKEVQLLCLARELIEAYYGHFGLGLKVHVMQL
eukprot:m.66979 g.66979  ORF g.66979 m.66979 type:complete len:200 (-) comp14071_c0_seq4:670-1269(-)